MISVFDSEDVSTDATDFQADGTAAPGTTGRLSDAGHTHPAGTGTGYQVVKQDVYCSVNNGDGTYSPSVPVVLDSPSGCSVVNGGYTIINGVVGMSGVPALDGSSWTISSNVWTSNETNGSLIGQIFAICVATD